MIDNLAKFTHVEGKRIAVVGAGAVGLDVIEYFTARGAQAVLIEMQDAAGRDLDIITKNAMLTMLDEHQVEQHMNTQLMAVAADHFGEKYTAHLRYPLRLRLCLSGDARQPDGSRRDRTLGQCQ